MITLITGTPGSSKTLFTIHHVKSKDELENRDKPESEKRAVYYHGIKELTLPWIQFDDATKWNELPAGSIIVIDECQSAFRPRGSGVTVPTYIADFETHRHKGYDIFLITQHPMLVDQNIRRLVGQHFHIVRKFGLHRSTVHEWQSTHEITQRNILSAVRRQFVFPKELFRVYKSAELHTHKARVPKRVYFLLAAPVLIIFLAWVGWTKARSVAAPVLPSASAAIQEGSKDRRSGKKQYLDTAAYLELYQPRLPSMPWTAPAYDGVTAPVEAPYPVACIQGAQCRCYDQQNNRIAVTEGFCHHFIDNGMFVPWKEKKPLEAENDLRERKGQGGGAATSQSARNLEDFVPKGQAG